MNATELTLIRGWINHISYTAMDEAYLDEGQSSKQIIGESIALLIQLGRLNKQAHLSQILQAKKNSDAWRSQALDAVKKLSTLTYRPSRLDDNLECWFDQHFAQMLSNQGVHQVNDLLKLIENAESAIQEKLLSRAAVQKIRRWFSEQTHLHQYLRKPAKLKRITTKMFGIVPFERLEIPLMLKSGNNSNETHLLSPDINSDQMAANRWLATLDNVQTQQLYRREIERFFLWSLIIQQKAISSLVSNDCLAYRTFLEQPQPRAQWVSSAPFAKDSLQWKPFVLTNDQPGLSRNSIVFAERVIVQWITWLHKHQYLLVNPYALIEPLSAIRNESRNKVIDNAMKAPHELKSGNYEEVRRHLIIRLVEQGISVIDLATCRVGQVDRERALVLNHPIDSESLTLIEQHIGFRQLSWRHSDAPLIGKLRGGMNAFSTPRALYKAIKKV